MDQQDEEEEGPGADFAAMMGFGGFTTTKVGHNQRIRLTL